MDDLRKRVLLLTGNPGVGKTTVLMKTVNLLKERGFSVGGMLSREGGKAECAWASKSWIWVVPDADG